MSDTGKAPEGVIVGNSRIPVELHRQLVREAQRACRSLNQEIVWRLRESLRAQSVQESAT